MGVGSMSKDISKNMSKMIGHTIWKFDKFMDTVLGDKEKKEPKINLMGLRDALAVFDENHSAHNYLEFLRVLEKLDFEDNMKKESESLSKSAKDENSIGLLRKDVGGYGYKGYSETYLS